MNASNAQSPWSGPPDEEVATLSTAAQHAWNNLRNELAVSLNTNGMSVEERRTILEWTRRLIDERLRTLE